MQLKTTPWLARYVPAAKRQKKEYILWLMDHLGVLDAGVIQQGVTLFEELNRAGVQIPMNSISNRHRQIITALQNLVRLS